MKTKIKEFFGRFGVYVAAGAMVLAVSLTFLITALVGGKNAVNVSGPTLSFSLPMSNPTIIKDYSSTALQENITLNQWEAHLAIDLTSEDGHVYSVLDGKVTKVDDDYMKGTTVTITHADGLVSVYSSLEKNLLVTEGQQVKGGQRIGDASKSAADEAEQDAHLHFYMLKDDQKVDPNNYLDLQNK